MFLDDTLGLAGAARGKEEQTGVVRPDGAAYPVGSDGDVVQYCRSDWNDSRYYRGEIRQVVRGCEHDLCIDTIDNRAQENRRVGGVDGDIGRRNRYGRGKGLLSGVIS